MPIIRVIALGRQADEALLNALVTGPQGTELMLPPQQAALLRQRLGEALEIARAQGHRATAVLTSPQIRFHFRRLMERHYPGLPVLSYAEIAPDYQVEVVAVVDF